MGRIAEATSSPPANTRARLRGENVQRLAGRKGAAAGWTFVQDGKGRKLDISHPLGRGARWLNMKSAPNAPDLSGPRAEVSRLYNRGDYERTFMLVRRAPPSRRVLDPMGLDQFLPYLAWVQARRGHLDQAIAALNDLAALQDRADSLVAEYVAVYRFQALIPSRPEIWEWIRRADEILEHGNRYLVKRLQRLGYDVTLTPEKVASSLALLPGPCRDGLLAGSSWAARPLRSGSAAWSSSSPSHVAVGVCARARLATLGLRRELCGEARPRRRRRTRRSGPIDVPLPLQLGTLAPRHRRGKVLYLAESGFVNAPTPTPAPRPSRTRG